MRIPFYMLLMLVSLGIRATAQEKTPGSVWLRLTHDNDFLSPKPKKDRYYTAGTQLALEWQQKDNRFINTLLPSPFTTGPSRYSAGIVQHIQTPANLKEQDLQPDDYPYAAALYASIQRRNYSDQRDQEVTSSFWLGMMGPAALGAETQKALHHLLNFKEPMGWGHQIVNNIVINYNASYALSIVKQGASRLNARAELQAGSLFSNFRLGAEWLLTNANVHFTGQLSQGGQPGKPHLYLSLQPHVTYVLGNELLEGSVRNPYAADGSKFKPFSTGNMERLLYGVDMKFGIHGKNLGLEFREAWSSPELHTTESYMYGSFSILVHLQ